MNMTDGPRTDDPSDLATSIDNSETTLNSNRVLSDAPTTESVFNQNTSPLADATTTERSFTNVLSDNTTGSIPSAKSSYVTPIFTKTMKPTFSKIIRMSTNSISNTPTQLKGVGQSSTNSQSSTMKTSTSRALDTSKAITSTSTKVSIDKSTMSFGSSPTTDKVKRSSVVTTYKSSSSGINKLSSGSSSKLSTQTISVSSSSRITTSTKSTKPLTSTAIRTSTTVKKAEFFTTSPAFTTTNSSQLSNSSSYLESTQEPTQTMGAGALVIVVLLPFIALFLIAIVTALRRKMKKSGHRIRRYENRNVDSKFGRNESQAIPLTKIEINNRNSITANMKLT